MAQARPFWMHLGILETGAHEQYLRSICRICLELSDRLTVLTTHEKHDAIRASLGDCNGIEWELKPPDQSMKWFRRRVKNRSGSFDILVIVSLYAGTGGLFQLSRLRFRCPTLLFVYNINTWFDTEINPLLGFRPNLKRKFLERIRMNVDGIIVEYPQLKAYLQKRFTNIQVPVYDFAPVVSENSPKIQSNDSFVISVPGNIDGHRRDYELLLDGVEQSFGHHPEEITLQLIGPPIGEYGARIMKRCLELREIGFKIRTFEDRLNHKEFDKLMAMSDLFISPLQYATRGTTESVELFGVTKGSGSFIDAIRYSTPVLYPDYILIPQYLRPATGSFRNASELSRVLERYLREPTFMSQMRDAARLVSDAFTLQKQRDRFDAILNEHS